MARLKKKKFISASALSHLPLKVGSALATGAGKALSWGFSRYARAPLANTSILALTVFTAMAGSNALYFQENRHPSPLFGPAPDYEAGLPQPVTPAVRQKAVTLPPIVVIDETGSVREAAAPVQAAPVEPLTAPIGNADVMALQEKLTTLGLYDGKVDGVFGPKTSGAIRRFEERAGLVPRGELTQDVIEAVASAPLILPQAEATPPRTLAVIPIQPTAQPLAAPTQPVAVAEAPMPSAGTVVAANEITGSIPPASIGNPAAPEDAFQPLPTPEPLALSLEATTQPRVLTPHRDLPDSPREVLTLAVATAKNGIQALASVIENGPQLGPTNPPVAEVAPTPATQSIAPIPTASVQTAVVQQAMPPLATMTPAPAPAAVAAPPAATAPAPSVAATEPAPIVVADTAPVEATSTVPVDPMTDRELVAKVQRGLTSLGFLRGEIDGVAGEATAKAIRNFEVYYNYDVTGRVTPQLVDLLVAAGAQI